MINSHLTVYLFNRQYVDNYASSLIIYYFIGLTTCRQMAASGLNLTLLESALIYSVIYTVLIGF